MVLRERANGKVEDVLPGPEVPGPTWAAPLSAGGPRAAGTEAGMGKCQVLGSCALTAALCRVWSVTTDAFTTDPQGGIPACCTGRSRAVGGRGPRCGEPHRHLPLSLRRSSLPAQRGLLGAIPPMQRRRHGASESPQATVSVCECNYGMSVGVCQCERACVCRCLSVCECVSIRVFLCESECECMCV